MKIIKFSESVFLMYVSSIEIRNELYPEYKINAHGDKNEKTILNPSMDKDSAFHYFEDNFIEIYEHYFPYFLVNETEEETFQDAFIIYAAHLYRNYKEVPVNYSEFRQWYLDVSSLQQPKFDFIFEADMFHTYRLLDKGERLLRNEYLMKESIERCTKTSIPLIQQKQLIDSIVACFQLRYNQEADNLVLALMLTDIDPDVLISNTMYQVMNTEGVKTVIDTIAFDMTFSHEYYPGWIKQYGDMDAENEDEKEEIKDAENPITIIQRRLNENKFNDDVEFNKHFRSLYDYAKHYWILRKHFLEHELEVYIYRADVDDELIVNDVVNIELRFENGKFYRKTGEEVYSLDALSHEISKARREYDEEKKKIDERAKQHLFNFLQPEQQKTFENESYFMISGLSYDYIIHKEKRFNNIIRIEKSNVDNKRSLCITPEDVHISEFDVIATTVLLIKTGKEDILNSIANSFPLNEIDEQILNKALQCA